MDETYRVIIDKEAEEKIADIVKYLTENASPRTAENVRAGLFEAMKGLRTMPESYGLLRYVSSKEKTYRRILKWSYLIIFYIKEDEKEVIIVDITHSSQDPQRLIDKFSD